MPRELLLAAYPSMTGSRPVKMDAQQNSMMVDFMRNVMRVMNDMEIEAMECYHSICWDNDAILNVVLDKPNVEFWSVHAPYGTYADPSSPDDEIRQMAVDAYLNAVNVAGRIGAKVLVAHPGANAAYDISRKDRFELVIDPLSRVADAAAEVGLKMAVEPLPKNEIGNNLDDVLRIIERLNRPNVGINFDVNHLFPPESVPDLIRKAGDRIFSVHISDQDGQERHWLPFAGTLDWPAILAALKSTGYTGPLIYETHIREATTCEDVGKAVVENYRQLIECL